MLTVMRQSWLVGCFNIGSLMLATLGMSFAVGVQVQAYAMLGANYHDERWHAVMVSNLNLTDLR